MGELPQILGVDEPVRYGQTCPAAVPVYLTNLISTEFIKNVNLL